MTFLASFVIIGVLSHPLLRLLFEDIGFVYGGNRSFASYSKTKTVESAVWCLLTQLDDGDSQQVTGSKYLIMVQDQT
jgi:hypothetical protein